MEREVLPGVFLTDFRQKEQINPSGDQNYNSSVSTEYSRKKELLEADIREAELQLKNLKRSNEELIEALREDPDPVYKEAIEENLIVMSKKKKLVEELRKLLDELQHLYPDDQINYGTDDGPQMNNFEDNETESTNYTNKDEQDEGVYL